MFLTGFKKPVPEVLSLRAKKANLLYYSCHLALSNSKCEEGYHEV